VKLHQINEYSLTKTRSIFESKTFVILGVILVAFNLRPAITSIGPLINLIRSDTGISNGLAGMLTTLPLIAFAFISAIAPKIAHKIGNELTVFMGLIILSSGILIRSTEIITAMFIGTSMIGLGIAIGNVLLPGIVKTKFPNKVGLMTGVYSTSMGLFASLGPGISIIFSQNFNISWENSLKVWVILSALAIIIWIPQTLNRVSSIKLPKITPTKSSILRSPLAWQVTLFMGLQSFLFYCMVTWLPEILHSRGLSLSTAGWMLSLMQFTSLPLQFLTPILAERLPNQKSIIAGIGIFSLTGFIGIITSSNIFILALCTMCLGIALGCALSISLAFFILRTKDAKQAANLSGMAQSVGYLLAAIGPFAVGFLFDQFETWIPSLIICICISIVMTIVGFGAGRDLYVLPTE
jgi:MFS transporter, CP family, cyanate transporter